MSADTTRMLVLGVVQIFEPANGYQLRRELLSWEVDTWANINPGSIYSMLSTLTKQGMVERIDLVTSPGVRPVAVYLTTEAGRAELLEIVRAGIREVHQFDTTEFYAAMSLMSSLIGREEIIALLEQRVANLRYWVVELEKKAAYLATANGTPPHVARLMGYSLSGAAAEIEWILGFIESVRQGDLVFFGEGGQWEPENDDPAWRMVGERALYLEKLAQLRG